MQAQAEEVAPAIVNADTPPASPCVKSCAIEETSGLCTGCGRTLDEIARWSAMDVSEQRAVIAALSHRIRDRGAGYDRG